MPRFLLITLKVIGVVATTLLAIFLATNSELSLHIGTTVLILAASTVAFFSKTLSLRAQALGFLGLTVAVNHAINRYFWIGVWDRGYPWPYSHGSDCPTCSGFIGTIIPFMNEVATVCFWVLASVAFIAIAWHLTRRSRGAPCRQADSDPLS